MSSVSSDSLRFIVSLKQATASSVALKASEVIARPLAELFSPDPPDTTTTSSFREVRCSEQVPPYLTPPGNAEDSSSDSADPETDADPADGDYRMSPEPNRAVRQSARNKSKASRTEIGSSIRTRRTRPGASPSPDNTSQDNNRTATSNRELLSLKSDILPAPVNKHKVKVGKLSFSQFRFSPTRVRLIHCSARLRRC